MRGGFALVTTSLHGEYKSASDGVTVHEGEERGGEGEDADKGPCMASLGLPRAEEGLHSFTMRHIAC